MFRTLIPAPRCQMTTLLPDRNFKLLARYPSTSPWTSGSTTNFQSSTLLLYRAIPHVLLRQELFSRINLSIRPNPMAGVHSETKKDSSSTVKSWNTSSSRINSTYLRIARQAGIASNPPLSRPISQETLRKWERSARELSIICNQAACFNRCLLKVQQNMHTQLRTIRTESKGKAAGKVSTATDELQFLLDFNSGVC